MKKIIAILTALLIFPVCCIAEIDLTGMTYDELVALKDQINLAIWNSEEWQEVEVPYGVWEVGVDIPAGKWTVKPVEGTRANIHWGSRLNASGTDVDYQSSKDIYELERIYHKNYRSYEPGDPTEVTWDLQDGQFFVVTEGIVIFSPYSGKPSLGFK